MSTNQIAPGELELVREFVNTYDVELDTDELSTGANATDWLAAHSVPGSDDPLDDEERARLLAVREALRDLLHANNSGDPPPARALDVLNEQSSEAALGLRFDAEGADLMTTCGGVDSTIAHLLAIVHESMRAGTWQRLKACPASDCQWAFYDHSRNRSGTWCVMGECGNRAKARAYRERHRHESGR